VNAERVLGPIVSHLAEWEVPHVELAIHGTQDAGSIAEALDAFCRRELQCAPAQTLFYQSSVAAVAGLQLEDGRRVVVKAHQPDWTAERLREVARLQSIVATRLGLAPRVLAGPAPMGNGFATVEEYVARGIIRNGHEPVVRRALAESLSRVIECLTASANDSQLPPGLLTCMSPEALWPRPHSKLFDFEATSDGAQYIDEIAVAARARFAPIGRQVIGHVDWRAEHVRFEGDSPSIAFDWDGLAREREPALVGSVAHMFCADWSRDDLAQAPTMDEARLFVAEYEAAAGKRFSSEEAALCGAAFAYAVAYTSRCGHAAGLDLRNQPGTFHHLLWSTGERLLELCG